MTASLLDLNFAQRGSPSPETPPSVPRSSPDAPLRERTRLRPPAIRLDSGEDKAKVTARVKRFYEEDVHARELDAQARLQRHAKMFQWVDPHGARWDGGSNIAMGDILAVVLRLEDTLQNAVLSTRPIVTVKSTRSGQPEREENVNLLLDYQFFREQDGEALIELLSCDMVREGSYKALTRWITEERETIQTRHFQPIPAELEPAAYFERILRDRLEGFVSARRMDPEAEDPDWDWRVELEGRRWVDARFYTDPDQGDEVIMELRGELVTYDGPKTIRYAWDHVLYPYFCENLQTPCPSNPNGAPHVIFVDYPTLEEVQRLVREGYYDQVELGDLEGVRPESVPDEKRTGTSLERAKDEMRGYTSHAIPSSDARLHGRMTRLTCFDLWEEGEQAQDVVWTMLLDPDLLLRARPLGEVSPGNPPRRPIAHSALIPISGRVDGIGIPELMEGLHDFIKATFDLMVDAGEIEAIPAYVYRQSSMVNPEDYHLAPGDGLPVTQKDDISLLQSRPQSGPVLTNLITLAERQQQDLTMQGDLQAGRIPSGKSAALRTSGGIQQVLAQGEARPERLLRRFFKGLRQIFETMWQLDRALLPEEKSFRVLGVTGRGESEVTIRRKEDLSGDLELDFQANILNSSKVAMQQAMETMLQLMLNPLTLQTGITDPEGIYRVMADYLRALGQQPEKYLKKPAPQSDQPRIFARDALTWIGRGMKPFGVPAEGSYAQHLEELDGLLSTKLADGRILAEALAPAERELLRAYVQETQQRSQQEQQQAQLQQQAGELRTQLTQQGSGTEQQPLVEGQSGVDGSLPSTGTPQ